MRKKDNGHKDVDYTAQRADAMMRDLTAFDKAELVQLKNEVQSERNRMEYDRDALIGEQRKLQRMVDFHQEELRIARVALNASILQVFIARAKQKLQRADGGDLVGMTVLTTAVFVGFTIAMLFILQLFIATIAPIAGVVSIMMFCFLVGILVTRRLISK